MVPAQRDRATGMSRGSLTAAAGPALRNRVGMPVAATDRDHGRLSTMVIEVGLIDVLAGREADFASAYAEAYPLLASTPGCRSVRMTRGVESPSRFVLLVEWDSVDDHLDNFRATDRFTRWRELIGPYFDGAPRVEHFTDVPAGSTDTN